MATHSHNRQHSKYALAIAAIVAASPLLAIGAVAQTTLPGIVVEGASLEQKPVRARPAQRSDTAPAQPSQNSAAASKSAGKSAPSQVVAPAPDAVETGGGTNAGGVVAGVPVRQIGTAVTVISSEEIEKSKATTFADVIRAQPGVAVMTNGTPGALTEVRMRGEDGKYTRVVVDGIDVSTTKDGAFDFSMLSADEIERVEIIRGPMSALYGSGAMGGVINVVTKAPRGPLGGILNVEGGSFGTKAMSGRIGGGGETSYLSVFGGIRDQTGYNISPYGSEKDGTRLATVGLKGGVSLSPDAKLDVVVRHTEKRALLDAFGIDVTTPPALKPFQTADDSIGSKINQRQTIAGVRLSWDALDGALTQSLKANYNKDQSSNRYEYPATVFTSTNDLSTRLTYGYGLTWRVPEAVYGRHTVSALAEGENETFTPKDSTGFFADGLKRERNRFSMAGEWRGVFAERLALTAGLRHDMHDSFQDFTTWRAAASYDIREMGLRPHASIGTGAKLPGMYDQFGPVFGVYAPNPNLLPETSRGFDVGVEQRLLGGQLVLDATYFRTRLENRITIDYSGFPFIPINLDGISRREGVELSAKYLINPQWSLGLAYTFTDARTPTDTRELRRVPHGMRATLAYATLDGRGSLNFSAIYNGRTPDIAFFNDGSFNSARIELDNYWLVQLAGSYKLTETVELYGRLENVLDQRYQEVYGYQAPGFGAYAGLKIRFGGETKR